MRCTCPIQGEINGLKLLSEERNTCLPNNSKLSVPKHRSRWMIRRKRGWIDCAMWPHFNPSQMSMYNTRGKQEPAEEGKGIVSDYKDLSISSMCTLT